MPFHRFNSPRRQHGLSSKEQCRQRASSTTSFIDNSLPLKSSQTHQALQGNKSNIKIVIDDDRIKFPLSL